MRTVLLFLMVLGCVSVRAEIRDFAYEGYRYNGMYEDICLEDGFYYKDAASFIVCSNGNSYIQPCADGSQNSRYQDYVTGDAYGYRDFCDVNLADIEYQAMYGPHERHPQPYQDVSKGYQLEKMDDYPPEMPDKLQEVLPEYQPTKGDMDPYDPKEEPHKEDVSVDAVQTYQKSYDPIPKKAYQPKTTYGPPKKAYETKPTQNPDVKSYDPKPKFNHPKKSYDPKPTYKPEIKSYDSVPTYSPSKKAYQPTPNYNPPNKVYQPTPTYNPSKKAYNPQPAHKPTKNIVYTTTTKYTPTKPEPTYNPSKKAYDPKPTIYTPAKKAYEPEPTYTTPKKAYDPKPTYNPIEKAYEPEPSYAPSMKAYAPDMYPVDGDSMYRPHPFGYMGDVRDYDSMEDYERFHHHNRGSREDYHEKGDLGQEFKSTAEKPLADRNIYSPYDGRKTMTGIYESKRYLSMHANRQTMQTVY